MRNDLTIIYYTSNKEDPRFEGRIQHSLWHTIRGLPLISVSQKPIDFGTNICVGDVGITGHNALRQLLIGVTEAKTRFVCTAESDFLYPKDYFEYIPKMDDIFYMAMPLYVLFAQKGVPQKFYSKPNGSESAMVIGRDFLIKKMNELFCGKEMWVTKETRGHFPKYLHGHEKSSYFYPSFPIVTFKTDSNMHRKTPHKGNGVNELPGWGSSNDLIRRYRA